MTEEEQLRIIKHRLAINQHAGKVLGNASTICRYFGISRQYFYIYIAHGATKKRVRRNCGNVPADPPSRIERPTPRSWARLSPCVATVTRSSKRSRCI